MMNELQIKIMHKNDKLIIMLKNGNIIKNDNSINSNLHNLLNSSPELKQVIDNATKFLNNTYNNIKTSTRVKIIQQNITSIPICDHPDCKNPVIINNGRISKHCSSRCARTNPSVQKKYNNTCFNKYGTISPTKSKIIKEKAKKTCQHKYNANSPLESKEILEKIKETNIERYGYEKVLSVDIVRKKIKETNIERYGYENALSNKNIHDKTKKSLLNNHGVKYPLQSSEILNKTKWTNIDRYNVEHCSQINIDLETLKLLNDKTWLYDQHNTQEKPLTQISEELNVNYTTISNYLRKHGIETHYSQGSRGEKEIGEFIKSLNIKCISGSRNIINPLELDIYIPEFNIAIEYNGLYWHSEAGGKLQNYHLMKTELCEEKGIRLIHIFEDEWRDQQQKCKDTISHLLGKSEKGVYARNTTIKEIPWKQAKDFLNLYHLLNAGTAGNYRIGAFDKENNLIGVMVFGHKNNEGSDNTIELKRFVTNKKNNPGLGSKMFKYVVKEKQYSEVIAFVDRRWFTGLVKSYIGFEQVGISPPALWWTNSTIRKHRRFKTKQQLIKEGHESHLTKHEMMKKEGFSRIWDSGKLKLQWEIKN